MIKIQIFLGALAFVVVPASQTHAQNRAGTLDGLRPGDAVRIEVWRQPEFSGQFEIAADGTLKHPLYRELAVTGVEPAALTEKVRGFLSRFGSDPQVVVIPLVRIAVGGEVRQPNLYLLSVETTLVQAVALAGGVLERGKMEQVKLIRGGASTNVDMTDSASPEAFLTVKSGDQIMVPRRSNILREYLFPSAGIISAAAVLINALTR